eukprot:13749712-Alexandrium_andersonii.AAC.1
MLARGRAARSGRQTSSSAARVNPASPPTRAGQAPSASADASAENAKAQRAEEDGQHRQPVVHPEDS